MWPHDFPQAFELFPLTPTPEIDYNSPQNQRMRNTIWRTYDTWSNSYAWRPTDRDLPVYRPVPYPYPIKAIQITIRVYDRTTGKVRQVVIVQKT